MTRTRKIILATLGVIAGLFVVAVVVLGTVLSHDSPCQPAAAPAGNSARMKAVVYRCYGSPEVLKVEEVDKPTPADEEVLVKVRAASINPLEWHYMTGTPYVMRAGVGIGRPEDPSIGVDFAGTVEAVGKNVTRFKVGDEVFGGKDGALRQYVLVRESGSIVLKPANITFEQAAAVPVAAVTALQGLRDSGKVAAGQKVLINGASGGVGTFAVQLAKYFGAEVTAVCSTRNVDLVKSLGADHVVDYTHEDFAQSAQRYDVIFDTVGNRSLADYRRVMTPQGIYVMVGGPSTDPWIGPLIMPLKAKFVAPFVSQKLQFFLADINPLDLAVLANLMQSGKLTPVIDRTYPLSDIQAAMRYLQLGHARGKVVIEVGDSS
jgi:NADPH:quinone reductase-like Zn-dependent oxidoreductase